MLPGFVRLQKLRQLCNVPKRVLVAAELIIRFGKQFYQEGGSAMLLADPIFERTGCVVFEESGRAAAGHVAHAGLLSIGYGYGVAVAGVVGNDHAA